MNMNKELKYDYSKNIKALEMYKDDKIIDQLIEDRINTLKDLLEFKLNLNTLNVSNGTSKFYIRKLKDKSCISIKEDFDEYRKWMIYELISFIDLKHTKELIDEKNKTKGE